jgi:uracil-DNA glycosylase family 4
MNPRLQLAVRNAACTDCRLSTQAEGEHVCVTGQGPSNAEVVIVTKFPIGGKTKIELESFMTEAGIKPAEVMWCSAMKCRTWDLDPNKTDQKACRPYLTRELEFIKPKFILALGGEALFATTGKAGIMKYRGKIFDHPCGAQVYTTISPSMVARNPGLRGGLIADLGYFRKLMVGDTNTDPDHTPGDRVTVVDTRRHLRSLLTALDHADAVSYDIETTGGSEFDTGAKIVSVAFTTSAEPDGIPSQRQMHVWEVPLWHPDSPWLDEWESILNEIYPHLIEVPKRIAHNAKFDTRWLVHFGMEKLLPTFDTIVAAALLDENRPKGLKPLAQQLLGADPWGVDVGSKEWWLKLALPDILEYNGLDTWHTMRLYYLFRAQLMEQPRLANLFRVLTMPLIRSFVKVERRGVWTDKAQLEKNLELARQKLQQISDVLEDYLPDNDDDIPETFWARNGDLLVNWNPSNFLRWFLFEWLGLEVIARGKTKDDGTPGAPSVAEAVMMELEDKHPAAKVLLERVGWNKMVTAFFIPYLDQLTEESRIHTTFKPWGTVTGRLSSGKEDTEKVTSKAQRRGVNLQQVPRDPLVRGVFGAPPGSSFVEADYSQIELRLAAYIAREETMLHLYSIDEDIHMATAMLMTGKPKSEITKEERKKAKAVNFGFLYGMGWAKFIQTAWLNYGVRVTEEEARAFRKAFFNGFPLLQRWHGRQRRLAHKYGRVETPMGRVRHLPDIYSPIEGVQAEAERQAINSPVQGFASDMACWAMVIIERKFDKRGLTGHPIGTVHDAVNFEIPDNELAVALPLIKDTMENLPLEKYFGFNLDVPIVADLKVGSRWGGAHEITPEQIYDWKGLVLA